MTGAKIAVVIPGYNHADYIGPAIASVLSQEWRDLELHVLDDGSSDDMAGAAERAVAGQTKVRCRIERQDNQGSARTLNRLIDRVDADYVAVLNSDDLYQPERLKKFAERAEGEELFFGFSGVSFTQSGTTDDFALFGDWYRSKIDDCGNLPTCGFALLTANVPVTSSNFFFSRELFDLIGGFDSTLTLTQDWDFAVEALRWTEPVLLPQRLMTYRVHPANTWRSLQDSRQAQSERVLKDYAEWAEEPCLNPLAPTPINWPSFFPYFARICTTQFSEEPIGATLPPEMLRLPDPGTVASTLEEAAKRRLVAAARGGTGKDVELEVALAATAALWEDARGRTARAAR
jgi:Glycosyl transferase family 2